MKFSRERLKEIGWLSGGQLVTLILSIVTIKLTTSIGPGEYGRYTLAVSITGVLSLGFFGPLEQGYVRFFFDHAKETKLRALFCDSLLLVLALSLPALLTLSVGAGILLHTFLHIDFLFSAGAASMVIISLLNVPVSGMMNAMRLRREVAVIQVAERVLMIVALFLLLSGGSLNATMVMLAMSAATGVSLCVRLVLFRRAGNVSEAAAAFGRSELRMRRRDIYKSIAGYSLPFVFWGAISWLQSNGERWVINGMLTNADVGRYGLAANIIGSSAVLLFTIYSQFITPIIFNNFSIEGDVRKSKGMGLIRIYSWGTFLLFGTIAVVLFLFGEMIVPFLSSKAFIIDGALLFMLTFGLGMFYLGQSLTTVGLALKKPEVYLTTKVLTALLSVAMYIAGCYWGGIFGVACAIVAVNSLYLFFVVLTNRSLLNQLAKSV